MIADALLVNQLVGGEGFRIDVLVARIAQFKKVWSAKGRAVDRLEHRLAEGIVDQCQPRIESGIEIAVLVIAHSSIEVQVGDEGQVALDIDAVVLSVPVDAL